MKKGRIFYAVSFLLIIVMAFSACGKKSMSYDMMDTSTASSTDSVGAVYADGNMVTEESQAVPATDASDNGTKEEAFDSTAINNSAAVSTGASEAVSQDKIIKNYTLDVETQNFDQLIKDINAQIKDLGGYVESSSISGKSYYDNNITRIGNIVARIPSKKADDFVSTVDETANVTNNQSTTENVTLQYVDIQSRVKALKTEEDRLYVILEKTEDLDSVITLESRLSDIRYELQNYESQLRVYDNQVEYSTVTMNIQEVLRITSDTQDKPTFANRIKNGFGDTLYHISEGFKDFMVWFIVNLPYLLIWAVIIFIIVIVIRRFVKKAGQKKNTAPPYFNYMQNGSGQQGQGSESQDTVNHSSQQSDNTQNKQ